MIEIQFRNKDKNDRLKKIQCWENFLKIFSKEKLLKMFLLKIISLIQDSYSNIQITNDDEDVLHY